MSTVLYIANLRKLVATCKFRIFLDESLLDLFACGVRSTELRDSLLNTAQTKDLTLPPATEMGLAFEVMKSSVKCFSQKKKTISG